MNEWNSMSKWLWRQKTGDGRKLRKKLTLAKPKSSTGPIAIVLRTFLSVPFFVDKRLDNPDCNKLVHDMSVVTFYQWETKPQTKLLFLLQKPQKIDGKTRVRNQDITIIWHCYTKGVKSTLTPGCWLINTVIWCLLKPFENPSHPSSFTTWTYLVQRISWWSEPWHSWHCVHNFPKSVSNSDTTTTTLVLWLLCIKK